MRIVLICAPHITEFARPDYAESLEGALVEMPPLGILVVASLLRQQGVQVQVVDANRVYLSHLRGGGQRAGFAQDMAERLAVEPAEVYGFASLCNCYPMTLQIAAALKQLRPECTVLLGGPHATATAQATLEECPFVDIILTGEVEHSIPLFVAHWPDRPQEVPGLVWRDGLTIERNPPPPTPSMDEVPLPAYDLWARGSMPRLAVEAGRGCPFRCWFCSTSVFFGRRNRMKEPAQLLDEIRRFHREYHSDNIYLIHDHFAVRPKPFLEFCRLWRQDPDLSALRWSCSLRVDAATPEVIQALADAGCSMVFLGVETGSPSMQRQIGKNLDLFQTRQVIRQLTQAGVGVLVSFIAGYPEETLIDLVQTLEMHRELLTNPLVRLQISTLSPLPDSLYHEEYGHKLYLDRCFSVMANQGDPPEAEEMEWIARHPRLFSAHYALPLQYLSRELVVQAAVMAKFACHFFRWVVAIAAQQLGGMLPLLWRWEQFARTSTGRRNHAYYLSQQYREDFTAFLEGFAPEFPAAALLLDQLSACRFRDDVLHELRAIPTPVPGQEVDETAVLQARAILHPLQWSPAVVQTALQEGSDLSTLPTSPVTLMRWFDTAGEMQLDVASPIVAAVVQQFRRPLSIEDGGRILAQQHAALIPTGIPVGPAFGHIIGSLLEQGVLGTRNP